MFDRSDAGIKLYLDIPDSGKPEYEFDPNELVATGRTKIDVELEVRTSGTNFQNAFIVSYCATSLNMKYFKALHVRENPKDPSELPTAVSVQNDPFPLQARGVRFEAKLPRRLLLHFGVIVRIKRGDTTQDFLCDPQIGNGPPSPGKILTALELS